LAKQAKEKAKNDAKEKQLQADYEENENEKAEKKTADEKAKAEKETAEKEIEYKKILLEKITKGDASDDEIREYAKLKKIETWHLKSIDTLKKEIMG